MTNRKRTPLAKPEIMSPAGYWPQLHAAIEAGADAVYFGLEALHRARQGRLCAGRAARRDAHTAQTRREGLCHLQHAGLRPRTARSCRAHWRRLPRLAPIRSSCRMWASPNWHKPDRARSRRARQHADEHHQRRGRGARAAIWREPRGAGARAVARRRPHHPQPECDCELEMFVHGALCVSYSGQCFSSEAWGGRSANRGQCAQACRLPYELIVDGELRPWPMRRYLLSPGDLYALQQMPEIVQIGVSALKIEGRYKDADYVALTTAAYRKAVDEAWAGLPLSITRRGVAARAGLFTRAGRPFCQRHQSPDGGEWRSPRHRGVLIGQVASVLAESVLIAPEPQIGQDRAAQSRRRGGLRCGQLAQPRRAEEGGRVYQVLPAQRGGQLELRFGNGAINFGRIRAGDLVWRSARPRAGQGRAAFHAGRPRRCTNSPWMCT
jgi:putative protease